MKKSLKRKTCLFSLLIAAMFAGITACSNTPQLIESTNAAGEKKEDQPKAQLSQKYSFTMGTSSSGGSVYAIGAGVAKLLGEKIDGLDIRAMATGGAVDNIGLMERGEAQFALNASNANYMAENGQLAGMEKQENVKGIVSLYPSVFHMLVSKDSKITSFEELKGTKGAVGASGSATDLYTTDVMHFYGYDYKEKKDFEPVYASTTDATDLFKDGHIDWALFPLGVPGSAVLDLTMANKVNILPIGGEDRDLLLEQFPYYVAYDIPGGTYTGFDEEIQTVGCVITLVADESVDEEVVYEVTKAIWENLEEVQSISSSLSWMEKEKAAAGIGVDLHPGAERYYREAGFIQ